MNKSAMEETGAQGDGLFVSAVHGAPIEIAGGSLAVNDSSMELPVMDSEAEAMMKLIEDTPVSPGLGNELNKIVRADTGVKLSEKASDFEDTQVDINLNEQTLRTPVDIDINTIEQGVKDEKALQTNNEVPADILNSYKERFGITKESLESMEGFAELSRGQQRMVLENLAQLTVGRIKDEAVDAETADFAEKQKDANVLKKIWGGIKRSFTKGHDVVQNQKKLAKDIQTGGIDVHKGALEQLVKGIKNLGPEVKEKADGTLEIQLIETKGLSPEISRVAENFNDVGTKFSKIPHDWGLETATTEQKNAFNEAKEKYDITRDALLKHMEIAGGPQKAIAAMAHTEALLENQRFTQTCPDAVEELKNIENQSAWTAALKSVGTERGLYMAGGFALRTALGAVAGLAAAPLAAAALGGIRGWQRAGDEMVAVDKAMRAGKEIPDSEQIKSAKARVALINQSLVSIGDEHVKAQLLSELGELNKIIVGTKQNMIEAVNDADIAGDKEAQSGDRRRGAVAKIDYIKSQIESIDGMLATGPAADESKNLNEKRAELVAKLDRRLNYTKMKISENKMIMGGKDERLANIYALTTSMAKAEAVVALDTVKDAEGLKAEERVGRMLGKKDEEIKSAQNRYKWKQAAKAGAIGGAFAGVGAAAAELAKWFGGGESTIASAVASSTEKIKEPLVSEVSGSTWAETQSGLHVTPEDLDAPVVSSTELTEPNQYADVNGLDLPADYQLQEEVPAGWTETQSGLRVLSDETVNDGLIEAAPQYTVQQGDSLSKIFAREIPGSTNGEVIRALIKMTPDELKSIGVESGNMNMIHPGDQINIAKMKELLTLRSDTGVTEAVLPTTPRTPFEQGFRGSSALSSRASFEEGYESSSALSPRVPVDGIRRTVEVFPNTAIPPVVAGAEDAELTPRSTLPRAEEAILPPKSIAQQEVQQYKPSIEVEKNIAFLPGNEQMLKDLDTLFQNGPNSTRWASIKNLRVEMAFDDEWLSKMSGVDTEAAVKTRNFLAQNGITPKTHPFAQGETLERYVERVRTPALPVKPLRWDQQA